MQHDVTLSREERDKIRLVPSPASIDTMLRTAGITIIPAHKIAAYKRRLTKRHPGTRIGEWCQEQMISRTFFDTSVGLLAIACVLAILALGLIAVNSQLDLAPVFRVLAGVGCLAALAGMVFFCSLLNGPIYPSYWVRQAWPSADSPLFGLLLVPSEAKTTVERVTALLGGQVRFDIDIFYRNGIMEDPIGYIVDSDSGLERAFIIWNEDRLVKL